MSNNQEISKPVLIEDLGTNGSPNYIRYGIFKCFCGNEFKTQSSGIKHGYIKSCGCFQKKQVTTHGMKYHPIYKVWDSMKQRCFNQKQKYYPSYGGRGITVCDRWIKFENFMDDMLPTYKNGLSLDRINNNGNYEPSNCRWTTQEVQTRNTKIIQKNNTSGYRGVCFDKIKKKWISNIIVSHKKIYLGSYIFAIDAAKAFDRYVIENNLEHTINGVL